MSQQQDTLLIAATLSSQQWIISVNMFLSFLKETLHGMGVNIR